MNFDKLEICKNTRKITADSLCAALKDLLSQTKPISEVDLRDRWLLEMRKHQEIFPDGWYIPPPHGIGVLFSTDDYVERVSYKSLRPKENWPQKNILLDRKRGIAYLFASPVDRKTGIIGDFGITIYFGKNKKVIDHLITSYRITKEVFNYAKPGMKFATIANYASGLCKKNNLINIVESSSDPVGSNIGHTVPSTNEGWTREEKEIIENVSWEKVCEVISRKRIFLNNTEQTILKDGMAITIEPRPRSITDKEIPMVSFHTIGLFYNKGGKELLTNFDEIFSLCEMNYLL